MKAKKAKVKKKRAELAILITRKIFPKYNTYVPADFIVEKLHPMITANKDKLIDTFTKRVASPLHKITDDKIKSKPYVISYLRRLAFYYNNFLASKRKSVIINGRTTSIYYYALVKA